MKAKRKQYSKGKVIDTFLIGSFYTFDVADPLGELPAITTTNYGHLNPVKKVMMKKNIKQLHAIFDSRKLKWKATIVVAFAKGIEQYERHAEIVWFGLLRDCEGEYQQAIEDIFDISNMSHYVICHIKAEVIGVDQIKDSDFSISRKDAA